MKKYQKKMMMIVAGVDNCDGKVKLDLFLMRTVIECNGSGMSDPVYH